MCNRERGMKMKVIEMDKIEDIIYNLHLIKTVIPDYTEGRNQSYSDEETEKIACQAVSQAIKELQEYRKLKEEEKLITLPCKVGDVVYEANINRNIISTYRVTSIVLMSKSRDYNWGLISGFYSNMNGFNESALGKTIFLTQEEAEKALEKSVLEKETNYGME